MKPVHALALIALAAASFTGSSIAATRAGGPSAMANAVAAARCGPGYRAENVDVDGNTQSYTCVKEISNTRICNAGFNRLDDAPKAVGDKVVLKYRCALVP